ncbi:hypothetical protein [Thalassobium sp. R2A62]|jgi:hypothetical protein|uniref:HalD/BesD family halogenase n=1 Tax=Thalassobium sp. R2A62 TaxID=633131 RepID=UPI0001B1D542|nr:hypothetical protein [Thalassobium sp. R2A62]EET49499.1 hypothetical protein TR2A62_2959 [Thalassobium sp. R2A62]
MTALANPLPFPTKMPETFEPLANEPIFDPAKHLQIEMPEDVLSLADLGYGADAIAECPTDFGVASIFRVLSDEGAACLLDVCRQLEAFTTSNARIARNVRGGTYRSRFLRNLCQSPELTDAMSKITGIPLLPHTIPHQMGHLNYNPLEIGENVDKWHVDTLRFDFVMFVTNPTTVEGGQFQYYKGTKDEVAELAKAGKPLDPAKMVSPNMPGPGYAVMQQGNMVVHRACGLNAPGERITMVNGYVPRDVSFPDFSRFDQLIFADPMDIVASEYGRHVNWMARERATAALDDFAFGANPDDLATHFEELASLMLESARQLRSVDTAKMEHFGDG